MMDTILELVYMKLTNIKSHFKACKIINVLYSKHPLMYKMHKMQTDYLWLSEDDVKTFNIKFQKNIDEMNFSYNLENGMGITDNWKDTNSFQESLYMLYSFLTSSLWCCPNNESLHYDYIHSSYIILTELSKRGVYTISGHEPTSIIRSSHNFIVIINDIIKNEFIDLLKGLYTRGVNVCARQVKRNDIIQEIIFAIDKGMFIYTEDFRDTIKLPNGFHSPGKNIEDTVEYSTIYTEMINPSFGLSGLFTTSGKPSDEILDFVMKETEISETHSLFYVETWSQTNDDFRVEDVLFQLWLEFNSRFGHMNDVRINIT